MPYNCTTCAGTGAVNGLLCPRCRGNKVLLEDSQGLTVGWGFIDLGRLVGLQVQSATAALEDVTGLNSPTVNVGTHTVMVRQLITGDITPGTATVSWIGRNGLTDGNVGRRQALRIAHPQNATDWNVPAILLKFSQSLGVGGLVEGQAEFQFVEV